MSKEYHVAVTGQDNAVGSFEKPFRSISQAARIAEAGDRVIVHAGEYREWVKPQHGGRSSVCRIVYEAAPGEKVSIKGSERIQNWKPVDGTVWKAELPNTFFGDYNPYKETLGGDWFVYPEQHTLHTGEVYLNGKSFYEAKSVAEVKKPIKRTVGYGPRWVTQGEQILEPEQTIYQWYAEVEADITVIYANFQGADPNKELTEINVRKCCFYPERTGLDYITVRGFELSQAACPWTPPTADQPGLIGPHWSKGWIIEHNSIHDAKCSGISIGKEISTGHNWCTRTQRKPGYQYQMEAVFRARQIGWSKEKTGSHIVRNNTIYDCGQNGIVGHMGCVFSQIYNNHIYNIAVKHEYFGYEIAGIKLHAAIDVQIAHNNIHDCTLGVWLDWQAQGTRVSSNLFYKNDRDLMVEVTHGPYIVDNNIFASEYNFDNIAQGGAYLHNLCCGIMRRENVLDRSTPYHFPHTTDVAGSTVVYSGDDRLFSNIFVGGSTASIENSANGTCGYNDCTASLEEYIEKVKVAGSGDLEKFLTVPQHASINTNCYYKGAKAFNREKDSCVSAVDPAVTIVTEGSNTFLEITVERGLFSLPSKIITTELLGMPRIVEAPYDDPNGNPITFDTDFTGNSRALKPVCGPFENLKEGFNRIQVWRA